MKVWSSILVFLVCTTAPVHTQFYSTGTAPASVRWRQIRTEHFQIIFPDEIYSQANRAANILETHYVEAAGVYEKLPGKTAVILHNRSLLANGYVTWAPRRMEWVVAPPEENLPGDFLTQLALHEYRHAVQLQNLDRGTTRMLGFMMGEAAVGAVAAYLPLWFYEGDAVVAETALSESGRGRSADFDRELRTIELERPKRYSYDQACLGSYNYQIPDPYQYGYQMVSYACLKYGSPFWNTTLKTVSHHPFALVPFYMGLHRGGAVSKAELYNTTFDSLRSRWHTEAMPQSEPRLIPVPAPSHFTEYRYVQPLRKGYFAVRSGIDDLTRFVYLHDTTETILYTPGWYSNSRVDVGSKYIVWSEHQPDWRWEQQNFSVVKLMNIQSGDILQFEKRTRRFAPVLKPGEERLACLSSNLENQTSIQILSVPGGELIHDIPLHSGQEAYSPVWLPTGNLACILVDTSGKCIVEIDTANGNQRLLYHFGRVNIDHLQMGDSLLYFTCELQMAANLYALNPETRTLYQVTQSRYGADFPSWSPATREILYSEYTSNGYQPAIGRDTASVAVNNSVLPYQRVWVEALEKTYSGNVAPQAIPETAYPAKTYRKIVHGINIHSWAPFYTGTDLSLPGFMQVAPGGMLFSQNKLSTVTGILGYRYQNHTHYVEPLLRLQGWYPVLEFSSLLSSRPEMRNLPTGTSNTGWDPGYSLRIRSYIPIRLTRNKYYRFIQPEISYWYQHYYYYANKRVVLGSHYLSYRLTAYNLLKRSQRDVTYRFGQTLQMGYSHTPPSSFSFASGWFVQGNHYLPGFSSHHSIRLGAAWEELEKGQPLFLANRISLPRGYIPLWAYNSNFKLLAEYSLPLFYPDWSLGPLVYIKRFHLTGFFDWAEAGYRYLQNDTDVYRISRLYSLGFILGSELHLLRFFMPMNPSFQLAYMPTTRQLKVDLSMEVDLAGY